MPILIGLSDPNYQNKISQMADKSTSEYATPANTKQKIDTT